MADLKSPKTCGFLRFRPVPVLSTTLTMTEGTQGAAYASRESASAPKGHSSDGAACPPSRSSSHRRRGGAKASPIAWAGLLFVALAVSNAKVANPQPGKPIVHVFLQLDTKSGALEKLLQQQLPTLTVTVFSRFRDLEDAAAARPDAMVAIGPVLEQRGKKTILQGLRGGKDREPYLLVSVGTQLDGPLSGKTIGAVDVMGRDGTQKFVTTLLKTTDVRVKRVAKTEDLLPLLEFAAADGIVIPSSALGRLTERTRLEIKSIDAPGGPIELPALAVFNDAYRDAIVKAFVRLDAATNKILGIDAWSAR